MRVLFVTREYPPFELGGVSRHTFNLVRNLTALGVECKVVSFGDSSLSSREVLFVDPSSSIASRGDCPLSMDVKIPPDIIRFTHVISKLLRQECFDIVHVEEPYVGALFRFPRKVMTVHDTSYGELRSIMSQTSTLPSLKRALFYVSMGILLEMACIATSRVIIVPFQHIKRELVHRYGISEGKIVVVWNGVELPSQEEMVDKDLAKSMLGLAKKPLVFTVAQHVARKRLDTLVEALHLLHKSGADIQAVIAGDGPLRKHLQNLTRRYELEKVIFFPGWVQRSELALYYRAADVFVLSSDYEAGPISLLEAMSYETSVVCTRIEGFASMLHDGVDCLMFPVGDAQALSVCLKRMLEDDCLRRRSSRAGRAFVENFSWQTVANEVLAIYEGLI